MLICGKLSNFFILKAIIDVVVVGYVKFLTHFSTHLILMLRVRCLYTAVENFKVVDNCG